MGKNADRFVDAYNEIDRHLRKLTDVDRGRPFSSVVKQASKSDAAVRRKSDDLLEFADLRNAIVHERRDGRAIAEPFNETVESIERLRDLLTAQPEVGSEFQRPVAQVSPDDSLSTALGLMSEGHFSQLPVYEDAGFVGLLTVATIAWWVSRQFDVHGGMLEDRPVGEVLDSTEDPEHHVGFLARTTTMFDAVEMFESRQRSGHLLDAALITETGARSQKPIGIITVDDLPALYERIGG